MAVWVLLILSSAVSRESFLCSLVQIDMITGSHPETQQFGLSLAFNKKKKLSHF